MLLHQNAKQPSARAGIHMVCLCVSPKKRIRVRGRVEEEARQETHRQSEASPQGSWLPRRWESFFLCFLYAYICTVLECLVSADPVLVGKGWKKRERERDHCLGMMAFVVVVVVVIHHRWMNGCRLFPGPKGKRNRGRKRQHTHTCVCNVSQVAEVGHFFDFLVHHRGHRRRRKSTCAVQVKEDESEARHRAELDPFFPCPFPLSLIFSPEGLKRACCPLRPLSSVASHDHQLVRCRQRRLIGTDREGWYLD